MKKWLKLSVRVMRRTLAFPTLVLWFVFFPLGEFSGMLVNKISGEDIVSED